MPAPDPTSPEVMELLREQMRDEDLQAELEKQRARLSGGEEFDDDQRSIVDTWKTAVEAELQRRAGGMIP